MYSVIIPTMWRSKRTQQLIRDLCMCAMVGEVIVINNNVWNNPHIYFSKVIYVTNGTNNYVNPSWNMGVRLAKYDNIAICNDDINFDPSLAFSVEPMEGQLIGMDSMNYEKNSNDLILRPSYKRGNGFGCLMLIKKASYKPIPESLRVSFGDDWLFLTTAVTSVMAGLKIETEMSTTSREAEFIAIAEQDSYEYLKLIS